MVRIGTKGLTFSPGCSHGPRVKGILAGRENAAHLVSRLVDPPGSKGGLQFGFPPVSRSFFFFIYLFYINMQRVVNCLVNKILAKNYKKNSRTWFCIIVHKKNL